MPLFLPRILVTGALLISIAASETVIRPHCGTVLAAQLRNTKSPANGASARVQAASVSGRVFRTAHFAIHYTLAPTIHRPRLTAADSTVILPQINSLLQGHFASTWKRDSTVNAAFVDTVAPTYVKRAAIYFERAYSYYADTMGMSMPKGGNRPSVFSSASSNDSLLTVEVVDMGTANSDFADAYYAITYPPTYSDSLHSYLGSIIILENDFLYNATVNASGQISGTSIKALDVNGQLLHDYAVDWDMGIKVTVSHEFYHAVQYVYTPNVSGDFHAWYELSAVGMEERLAPEVNDYFQYLPSVLRHHESVSLMTPPSTENYGNAMFHQYLTRTFGNTFDTKVWSLLKSNGNNLVSALTNMTAFYGASWDSVYASYAAELATAGRAGDVTSCTDTTSVIFTRDLHCWPQPSYDNLPNTGTSINLAVASTTFRLFKPVFNSTKTTSISLSGINFAKSVERTGMVYQALDLTTNPFNMPTDTSVLFVSVPNSSLSKKGQARLYTWGTHYKAVPNPATTADSSVLFYPPFGTTSSSNLPIVSESGLHVADLVFDPTEGFWTWNLRNKQGTLVPPGAYYYQFPGQPPKTLLILP